MKNFIFFQILVVYTFSQPTDYDPFQEKPLYTGPEPPGEDLMSKLYNKHHFLFGCSMHPEERLYKSKGEASVLATDQILMIANGHSEYHKEKINPAKYTRETVKMAMKVFESEPITYKKDPREMLIDIEAMLNVTNGGCSVSVALIDEDLKKVRIAQIGDVGWFQYRYNSTDRNLTLIDIYEPQVWGNGVPFHMAMFPKGDSATQSKLFELSVEENDIFVLANSGIIDNVFKWEIKNEILEQIQEVGFEEIWIKFSAISDEITKHAFITSITAHQYRFEPEEFQRPTPISVRKKELNQTHYGGRVDDMAIVIGQVRFKRVQDASFQFKLEECLHPFPYQLLNPKIKENDREKYEEAKLKYGLNVYGDGEADKNIGEIDPVDSRI